jgi:heterodisulfide reductase subunit A
VEPDRDGTLEVSSANGAPRIGVYVCHCGLNIARKVDVEAVVEFAATLPGVAVARDYKFMCSDPGQELIEQDIRDGLVDRVVVASCSPLMHEATFRRAAEAGGISPFQFQMASIREHVSWVTADGDQATEKAKALVAGAVRRVALHEPLERRSVPVHPDVMVVGGGIAGIHAALTLAEAGKHVYLVEREPSIGGQMAKFDKTFPTLDCAACILTPKMVQIGQHPNVDLLTYSEVEEVSGYVGSFKVRVRRKARHIDEDLCNGCGLCVESCTWRGVPSEFDHGVGTRPVAYTSFPQAVPRVPVIDRVGTSPCTFGCPAGIKAHGYVSLVRHGDYEQAFDLVLESTPLVGSLGRACYAPCETNCTRGSLEGPLPIRRLKRFVADTHYQRTPTTPISPPSPNGKRVAVIGSGPAGLTAAWQLARRGYLVKIFEAAPEPGGMLRLAIPDYRLPTEVVERDIQNLVELGVEIATDTRVDDLEELRRRGYDAVLVATGTPTPLTLRVPGEELDGVLSGLQFLRAVKLGEAPDLGDRKVIVVGGGNVAVDAARSARRLGAAVHMVCLESRPEMPAHAWEVEDALAEGVTLHTSWGVARLLGEGRVRGVQLKRCTAVFDEAGMFSPQYDESTIDELTCDEVVVAIGLAPDTASFAGRLSLNENRTIEADVGTLQTALPYVFAAGDVVSGASDIPTAAGQGRTAALMIDRWLRGEGLDGVSVDGRLPAVETTDVLARKPSPAHREPLSASIPLAATPSDFAELEPPLTEEEARYGAERCLDCGPCSECAVCVGLCPTNAIDLEQRDREVEIDVGAIVVSTGFKPFDPHRIPEYGYGTYSNVFTSLEIERLLNASGPTQGELVLRDGEPPRAVGIIHCVGSRDAKYNSYCSRVCCMYSLKLAHLIKERSGAEVYNFYIDMRTPGKGYEEFYWKVMKEGVHFIRGRVAEVSDWAMSAEEEGRLVVRVEDTLAGVMRRIPVDMVVLAVGMEPQSDADEVRRLLNISCGSEGFFSERHPKLAPVSTFADGIFLAGACQGPKDIPDSVAQAGAAAAEALALIDRGAVELEPNTAFVTTAACSGCRTCVPLCPFGAISFDEGLSVAEVNEVLCKGCGICVAACPSAALQQHLFTDEQILSEIEGVLEYA